MGVLLILLFILLVLITLIGHAIWVSVRWLLRHLLNAETERPKVLTLDLQYKCATCNSPLTTANDTCAHCGTPAGIGIVTELLKDVAATVRQVERFHKAGVIDESTYERLKHQLEVERLWLTGRRPARPSATADEIVIAPATKVTAEHPTQPESVVVSASQQQNDDGLVIKPDPIPVHAWATDRGPSSLPQPSAARQQARKSAPPEPPPSPRQPFAEMIAAFMEQNNIRWGEIIGGLLIIGCSTALVVSLWAQISSIPVLKFLIFTTVTAALFGVGLYTEHRWKLPTTSRGILTIATLLVPLNFLAIAAVSGTTGAAVIGSELIAPTVFLCLVYFAGRVLTPKWPQLLAVAVLGSSVAQLLIRHLATPDSAPGWQLALGSLPIACYVAATAWKLRIAMADAEIDETETGAIFITLGAATFAAVLPFGLLLYKSGPVSLTMMYLAPLVTLGGVPLLATGTLLWRRVRAKELVAARTAGTSIAVVGTIVVLSGMILAWPNPASIVPAALLNFAVFTALAVLLELPVAHLFAAGCLTLAYLVLFHVAANHTQWQNLRVTSLLDLMMTVSTGQALAVPFIGFLIVAEWLRKNRRYNDSKSYLGAAGAAAVLSLLLIGYYGFAVTEDRYYLGLLYLIYAVGAFWLAWRQGLALIGFIGSGLLLVSLGQVSASWLQIAFPWQVALLAHASVCALAAIFFSRRESSRLPLANPLNTAALLSSFLAIGWVLICGLFLLVLDMEWQPTPMLAQRLFWLALIWFVLLWRNRWQALFTALQIALTMALVLTVKGLLQQYDWYAYLPYASLHPWSLQVQGICLLLLSLAWVAARFVLGEKRQSAPVADRESGETSSPAAAAADPAWLADARRLLGSRAAFDRFVLWSILGGFVLLTLYGVCSGVMQELTTRDSERIVWDIAGFPHQYALGLSSWILLGLLLIALLATLRERQKSAYLLGAVGALATVCPLIAGWCEGQVSTASAWRFTAALFLVVASLPLWLRERWNWKALVLLQASFDEQRERNLIQHTRVLLLAGTVGPLLLLTIYPALRAIDYLPVHGPSSGVFYWLGDTLNYCVPIIIAALALIAYALREQLARYAFAAGLLFNLTVTMAYLLTVVAVHGSMDRVISVETIQLNTITVALYALVWFSTFGVWGPRLTDLNRASAERLLKLQIAIAVVANASLIGLLSLSLVARPSWTGRGTVTAGGLYGWLAVLLTTAAASWFARIYRQPLRAVGVCLVLLGASCLAAFTTVRAAPYFLAGFQALLIFLSVTAWIMWFAAQLPARLRDREPRFSAKALGLFNGAGLATNWAREAAICSALIGAIVVTLACESLLLNNGTGWSVAPLLAMSALAAALQWQTLKRAYLYGAGLLFTAAVYIWWARELTLTPQSPEIALEVVVIGLCSASVVWLWLELRARKLIVAATSAADTMTALSFHNLAAVTSLSLLILIAAINVGLSARLAPRIESNTPGWLALLSLGVLMTACLWDRLAQYAVAGLYLTGLVAVAMALSYAGLAPRDLGWAAMVVLAIYAVLTAAVWRWREPFIARSASLRIPRRPETSQLRWLVVFNLLAISAVVMLAYGSDSNFGEWPWRSTTALAVAAQGFTLVFMAPKAARHSWQKAAFALFALGGMFLGWAWLVPGVSDTWLNRAVILMVEMFAIVSFLGLELEKILQRDPEWSGSVRDCAPYLVAIGCGALIMVLCTELSHQLRFGIVLIGFVPLLTVALTLLSAAVVCVLFALSPAHDPLNLPEQRRRNYVYVAEALLALLFMHVRLTMPWLFTGFFERYWPVAIIAIAYLGVTASELLRRRGVLVIAHPLERTGAFLPLLPVIGFWLTTPRVDYSLLLFGVGGLYGLLSIMRRSFGFGILAAVSANGGLWYLWHRTAEYHFAQHPQLWLIPAACSVLVAVYLNREDFNDEQMVGIRYLALVTIYASSTADIFINGVANSPWLPMILAALALVGVLCGIVLRIRAFLVLGSVFLLLAITTMIYYASVNLGWTWLWYVAGIVTGTMIIATFAVFEKKREEMLRVVEGLKEWQR